MLAGQLVEATLRLTAVFEALDDRRVSIAERLRGPLPGAHEWVALAQLAATAEPEGVVRRLALDEGGGRERHATAGAARAGLAPRPDRGQHGG